jgi:hypothetical protein
MKGEVSEKLVLEGEATGFPDPDKGGWEPGVGPSGRENLAQRAQLETNGCIVATAGRPKNQFRMTALESSSAFAADGTSVS